MSGGLGAAHCTRAAETRASQPACPPANPRGRPSVRQLDAPNFLPMFQATGSCWLFN